jgi:NAD(P)-dependent dehydrogenase (short-subunit alcohol dehydrogenase family)
VSGAPETPAIDLTGAVVLVTGGVRGVGAGIAGVFRQAGARVVTCARHDHDEPDFVRADVREPDDVDRLVATIVDRHGRLDVVVNNAGGSPYALAADASPNLIRKVVDLNLLAPLLVSQAANAVMQQQGGGVIVMVGSVSGLRPSPGTAAYGAAKAGLHNLVATLAVEWAPKVRVNALAVGMVRTDSSEWQYDDVAVKSVPLGRLAEPEEIGMCALFLASPLASYVTGATLTVHGGGA